MLQLTHLACDNFMSFEHVDLDLTDKCYVIKGNNTDNSGQVSNGAGKTSLLDIICIAILGQSLTDRDLKRCVNRLAPNAYFAVSVTLTSTQTYVITRRVYSNTRGQELVITCDGGPINGLATRSGIEHGVDIRAGNAWILDNLLGLSREDLLSYFMISERGYNGFLSAKSDVKVNVIARFSNAKLVDKALANLKNEKNRLDSELFNITTQLANLAGQVEGLNSTISDQARQQFEQDKHSKIHGCLSDIEQLETNHKAKLDEITAVRLSLAGDESTADSEALRGEQAELVIMSRRLESELGQLRNKLAGQLECPKCHHTFILNQDASIADLELEQADATESYTELKGIIEAMTDELLAIKDHNYMCSQLQSLTDSLEAINRQLAREVESIEKLEAQEFEVAHVKDKLMQVALRQETLKSNDEALQVTLLQVTTWLDRLERFKFDLINKPLAMLCHLTNQVLVDIGSAYSLEIEGFKRLKSGELRAELTPIVYTNGLAPELYDQLSTGERVRVSLACDLALQQLLNNTSKGGLNLYLNDELVGGLDSLGMELVARAFNKLKKTILLVSHSGSEVNYEHTLTVVKQGNISKVI